MVNEVLEYTLIKRENAWEIHRHVAGEESVQEVLFTRGNSEEQNWRTVSNFFERRSMTLIGQIQGEPSWMSKLFVRRA